jgi:predicted nucleic acid-binding protein
VIRVVIDTNIFVSSFFGGNPRKIVDLWKSGQLTLCLSKPIVHEYVEVLKRLGLHLFSAKTPELNVVEEDPDDNKFIECAVALKCTFVISGDKHLTEIRDYMGIEIVTPKEFLDSFPKFKS